MTITVNEVTKVISIPQADLTPLGGGIFTQDTQAFRLELRDWESSTPGAWRSITHKHNLGVTVGGTILAPVIEIINGYTLTYEDGQYRVIFLGSNNNFVDVANVNQVSLVPTNSAGLIDGTILAERIELTVKGMYNRQHSNEGTGKFEQYDDANVAIEYQGDLFMDNDRLVPYDGTDDILIRDVMVKVP